MAQKKVTVFVSYARANERLAKTFLDKLKQQTGASKRFKYDFWIDEDILVGKKWDEEIKKAIDDCDLGLLLVSPAFLASPYITEEELPGLLRKRVIPVMLWPVVADDQDLKGLEEHQIFRLEKEVRSPRAFGEVKGSKSEAFAQEVYKKMERRLKRRFPS